MQAITVRISEALFIFKIDISPLQPTPSSFLTICNQALEDGVQELRMLVAGALTRLLVNINISIDIS